MGSSDVLTFAFRSFFLGLFVSALLTIAQGGDLLLDYDRGLSVYEGLSDTFSTKSSVATASDLLSNIINSDENPLAFDIVLGIINVGFFLFKIIDFLITCLVNYFLLSVWLVQAGTPGAVAGLLVFSWQFWTLWHISKFVFKGERVGN